jgi:hypothetical protein
LQPSIEAAVLIGMEQKKLLQEYIQDTHMKHLFAVQIGCSKAKMVRYMSVMLGWLKDK